jgi:heme/copper-type cytochrome/quinol oxidase subunit 1
LPRLSVWFIRSSLVYLALGFTFGGLLLLNKGFPLSPNTWRLLPGHIEFVLFGWTVQLIMGMGFWILPRFAKPPVRGKEHLVWTAFILLNAGVIFLTIASFGLAGSWIILLGRLMEAAAVVAFTMNAWPRVKAT